MKKIAYVGMSLDGYIADAAGGVDWLNELPNPDQSDYGFAEFMKSIDAVLMGANTFRVVQSYGIWPYHKPVYVASNSIKVSPDGYQDKITLVKGDAQEILMLIEKDGNKRLYVDGGKLIQSCLKAGLLDEMIITHIPVILGDGISLFSKSSETIALEHVKTNVLGIGLVKSHYRISKVANK